MRHTEESKRKLSEMRRGSGNPFYGRKHTEESKRRISNGLRLYDGKRQYRIHPQSIRIPIGLNLGYLAGIVDGEGSIRFRKGRPFIAIYNSDDSLFQWLLHQTGRAPVVGDYRGRVPGWAWAISAARDLYALGKALEPHLVVKKSDLNIVLRFLEDKYGGRMKGGDAYGW